MVIVKSLLSQPRSAKPVGRSFRAEAPSDPAGAHRWASKARHEDHFSEAAALRDLHSQIDLLSRRRGTPILAAAGLAFFFRDPGAFARGLRCTIHAAGLGIAKPLGSFPRDPQYHEPATGAAGMGPV
jgi:hypothetical protein